MATVVGAVAQAALPAVILPRLRRDRSCEVLDVAEGLLPMLGWPGSGCQT